MYTDGGPGRGGCQFTSNAKKYTEEAFFKFFSGLEWSERRSNGLLPIQTELKSFHPMFVQQSSHVHTDIMLTRLLLARAHFCRDWGVVRAAPADRPIR